MTSKTVLLCGYYGFGNGGDEALLATLIQMLPDNVTPVVMSATPAKTANQHQVATCDRNNFFQVLSLMLKAKGFIWGGGSLIQDSSSWASPLFYIAWMTLAQMLGLKTVAWAQGIGPLNRGWIESMSRRSFSACTARSTRDVGSAKLLKKWALNYHLAPDPVWSLEGSSSSEPDEGIQKVAVVLRSHTLLTETRLKVLTEALQTFEKKTQAQILLLPFQRSLDYDIAVNIQDQLSENAELLMLEDPRQLKGIFQTVELTIAMRLHALIMAAAEGCRCFALSYDPKVTRLMEDLDLQGYELDTLPSDSVQIANHWQKYLTEKATFDEQTIRDRVSQSHVHQKLLHEVFQ